MNNHDISQPDFGTGQKKLSVYTIGVIICAILTLLSFWAVMSDKLTKHETFILIYSSAIIQFLTQVICFLRLNTDTEQSKTNVMSILFTFVIVIAIIAGSLWIMWNLNYYMMH